MNSSSNTGAARPRAAARSVRTKLQQVFQADHHQPARRRLFNSLWAILVGFVITSVLIAFTGNNPFAVLFTLFSDGFSVFGNRFISIFIGYLIAALAVALCFKCGLFNIGISGQMMMGGFTTLVIFQALEISGATVFLALIMAVVAGAFSAVLAGALKTYFNVNEVVSTIMLNWIIFFVIKFLVQFFVKTSPTGFGLSDGDSLASNLSLGYTMPNFFQPTDFHNSWFSNRWNWIIITLALVLVSVLGLGLAKTAFGYKIKMTGLSQDAANYSGTNKNALVMNIMALSGGLSGLAGFIWYVGQGGQIDIAEQPLVAGFDAIAIALIVFNNPVGILASSFIYGIINAGSLGIPSQFVGLPTEINEIIIGTMVYIAAVCVVFSKFHVAQWCRKFCILARHQHYRSARVTYWSHRIKYWQGWFSTKRAIHQIKVANGSQWRDIKAQYAANVAKLETDLWYEYQDQGSKFSVEALREADQLIYFETVAKLRKERDLALAQAAYFEHHKITSARFDTFLARRQDYWTQRDLILSHHDRLRTSQKLIQSIQAGRIPADQVEALLLQTWAQMSPICCSAFASKVAVLRRQLQTLAQTHQVASSILDPGGY